MLEWKGLRLEADIAGIRVALSGPEALLAGATGDGYRRFASPDATRARISVELLPHLDACRAERGSQSTRLSLARGEAPDYPLELAHQGSRLTVSGLFVEGWLDLEKAQGEALACSRDAIGAVENYFRVAVSHLLLPRGGFLLHAMAVVCADGTAVVGFGESGAGKTTLASLAGGRPVISDDLVAIRRDSRGRLVVIPAPFRAGGAAPCAPGHPIRHLLRLSKAKTVSIRALSPAEGAASLVASMPFVLERQETATLALALAEAASRDPGVSLLAFPPEPFVWDELERRP